MHFVLFLTTDHCNHSEINQFDDNSSFVDFCSNIVQLHGETFFLFFIALFVCEILKVKLFFLLSIFALSAAAKVSLCSLLKLKNHSSR